MLCYKALSDQTVALRVILLATLVTHGPCTDLAGKPLAASIRQKKKVENMPRPSDNGCHSQHEFHKLYETVIP